MEYFGLSYKEEDKPLTAGRKPRDTDFRQAAARKPRQRCSPEGIQGGMWHNRLSFVQSR